MSYLEHEPVHSYQTGSPASSLAEVAINIEDFYQGIRYSFRPGRDLWASTLRETYKDPIAILSWILTILIGLYIPIGSLAFLFYYTRFLPFTFTFSDQYDPQVCIFLYLLIDLGKEDTVYFFQAEANFIMSQLQIFSFFLNGTILISFFTISHSSECSLDVECSSWLSSLQGASVFVLAKSMILCCSAQW
ncbi:hypothetical protein G9A89_013173 [Geosiphon pyriformis]|nr:hypothetical protein G9A89_013173 [Geosiphon pyriformis]